MSNTIASWIVANILRGGILADRIEPRVGASEASWASSTTLHRISRVVGLWNVAERAACKNVVTKVGIERTCCSIAIRRYRPSVGSPGYDPNRIKIESTKGSQMWKDSTSQSGFGCSPVSSRWTSATYWLLLRKSLTSWIHYAVSISHKSQEVVQMYFCRRDTALERIPGEVRQGHGRRSGEAVDPPITSVPLDPPGRALV